MMKMLSSLLSIYLGIALIFLPVLFDGRHIVEGIFGKLSYIGVVFLIIGSFQAIFDKLQKRLLNMFDYGNKMNTKGITHLGIIDDKAFDFYGEIFAYSEDIDIIYNLNFKSSKVELFLFSLLNDKKKNIRVVFTNYKSDNLSMTDDAIKHFIRKNRRDNGNCRYSEDSNISNIIVIFQGKVCVFYNNDIMDGSVFYTVLNSVNPNYDVYKEMFNKQWNESKEYQSRG